MPGVSQGVQEEEIGKKEDIFSFLLSESDHFGHGKGDTGRSMLDFQQPPHVEKEADVELLATAAASTGPSPLLSSNTASELM